MKTRSRGAKGQHGGDMRSETADAKIPKKDGAGGKSLASKLRCKIDSKAVVVVKRIAETPAENRTGSTAKTLATCSVVKNVKGGVDQLQLCNFGARRQPLSVLASPTQSYLQRSHNFAHFHFNNAIGTVSSRNKLSCMTPLVREVEDLTVFRNLSPFKMRITSMEWHPSKAGLVVGGSKGGDIILWESTRVGEDHTITGRGPGGSISAMKFHPFNSDYLLTTSLDGHLTQHDLNGGTGCRRYFLSTGTWDYWYTAMDVSGPRNSIVAGDSTGNVYMVSLDGKKIWTHRLHKQKVTHAEFSPREDWLFCTASTDKTVKMWDARKMSGKDSALVTMQHDKPINSAYFSRTNGCRLLTTDQFDQLRVYCAPDWRLERTIIHPHRFFQHITPIKASWHPLRDLIVVGRYPLKERIHDQRCVNVIDADSGDTLCQLTDPDLPGLTSLNKFNNTGDKLLSSMGVNLVLWYRSAEMEQRQLDLMWETGFDTSILGSAFL